MLKGFKTHLHARGFIPVSLIFNLGSLQNCKRSDRVVFSYLSRERNCSFLKAMHIRKAEASSPVISIKIYKTENFSRQIKVHFSH